MPRKKTVKSSSVEHIPQVAPVAGQLANHPETSGTPSKTIATVSQTAEAPSKVKDETRKIVAITYVRVFLVIVGLTVAFMLFRCYPIDDIKDILLAEAGILSAPLGFIIGFYFKEELSKQE